MAAIIAVSIVVIGKLSPNPAIAVLAPIVVVFCVLAVLVVRRADR